MKTLLELRQQKATFTEQMRSLLTKAEDEKHSLTADEAKQFDELRHYILTGETRTLSTGVPSEGGYTVIPELNKQIMQQLADESVMRRICTVKTTRSNEYKQLVSVGGAAVVHGEEGKSRSETATSKMEEVSIKLFPIYAYPKTTQEIIDFSDVDSVLTMFY
ncbi:Putative capsid protein of prophage CP-933C (Putative major head protein) (fragment) [Xenorhabdus bovienii str. Jollieti]|uniref:Putative capsid protein of prophage CP-933C (Putative major head protein) n=1 Tax=Xenorhabdus bovienii (strain SS-2004) TaxID=406818 RepID=D3V5V3_XENBS